MKTVRIGPPKVRPVDEHIVALRTMRIGPAFPRDEGAPLFQGMHGLPRPSTKKWQVIGNAFRERRRKHRLAANASRAKNR